MATIWTCSFGIEHEYPDDWNFGPNHNDPRYDWRYEPTSYIYLDADMKGGWQTSAPLCDDEALDDFTKVQLAANYDPPLKWLMARRPGEGKPKIVPFYYSMEDDTIYPFGSRTVTT